MHPVIFKLFFSTAKQLSTFDIFSTEPGHIYAWGSLNVHGDLQKSSSSQMHYYRWCKTKSASNIRWDAFSNLKLDKQKRKNAWMDGCFLGFSMFSMFVAVTFEMKSFSVS